MTLRGARSPRAPQSTGPARASEDSQLNSPSPAAPIGILGGSFDPVHNAHLRLAREARSAFGLQSVRWVPSGSPGHREAPRASAADRLEMLRLALAGDRASLIDAAELFSSEPTYTVNTLSRLREELGPALPFVFLIGADQLQALDRWREWKTLFELSHFGVALRPGYPITASTLPPSVAQELARRGAPPQALAAEPAGRIALFRMPELDISSTALRRAFAEHRHPAGALPENVLGYIESKSLYQSSF